MAWVPRKNEEFNTAKMVELQALFLKYNPDFWVKDHHKCPCPDLCNKRKRSDEIAHCMLNYYGERIEVMSDQVTEWKRRCASSEREATYALNVAAQLETSLRAARFSNAALMNENVALMELLVQVSTELNPSQRRRVTTRVHEISHGQVNPYAIIDLTADDEDLVEVV